MITGGKGPTGPGKFDLSAEIAAMPAGTVRSFLEETLPVAEYVNSQTGISRRLLLAQYSNETDYGLQMSEPFNFGNIGVYGGGPDPGFSSPMAFARAQAQFYNANSRYRTLEQAGKAGESIDTQAVLLGESGYASGGYREPGQGPGTSLEAMVASLFGSSAGTAGTGGQFPSGQKAGGTADVHPPSVWQIITDQGPNSVDAHITDWVGSIISGGTDQKAWESPVSVAQLLTGWWTDFFKRMMLVAFFGLAALIVLWVTISHAGLALPGFG